MAITINSLSGVTGITTSLVAGGSLLLNTTYYVTVIAKNNTRLAYTFIPWDITSPIVQQSAIFIPAGSPNKTIRVSWTAVSGAVQYEVHLWTADILINKYTLPALNGVNITGTTFDVTNTNTSSQAYNSSMTSVAQASILPYGISKLCGIVDVVISGDETLQSIKTALTTAGLGDSVYYDGFSQFGLRGWIRILAGSVGSLGGQTGTTSITHHNLVFIHGFIYNLSNVFNVTLGGLATSPYNYSQQPCTFRVWCPSVNLINIKAYQSTFLVHYGYLLPNTLFIGTQFLVAGSSMIDCSFSGPRNTNTDYSGQKVLNMDGTQRLWQSSIITNMYWQGTTAISLYVNGGVDVLRDCTIKLDNAAGVFDYNAANTSAMQKRLYDLKLEGLWTDVRTAKFLQSKAKPWCKLNYFYSLGGYVLDEDKAPLNGVDIKIYDRDNTLMHTITTDANGLIAKTDILAVDVRPDNASSTTTSRAPYDSEIRSPFTLVFSKAWYETFSVKQDITSKINQIFTLKTQIPLIVTPDDVYVKTNPQNYWAWRDIAV